MDLESPDPVPASEPPAADPPAPPPEPPVAAAPEPPADPDEAQSVEMQGGKYVPIHVLHAVREQNKALKQKAEEFDQTIGYVRQAAPYIEFLKQNPTFMTQTAQQTQPTPVTTTQPADEAAESLARTLDLYTADGKPDVKRAQTIRQIIKSEAQTEAEAKVKPLAESTQRERVSYNYQRALASLTDRGGHAHERQAVDALWARTDPNILATEDGAAATVALALGLIAMSGQQPRAVAPPQQPPPVVTERPGSRQPNVAPLGQLEEKIAGMRGVKASDWQSLTRNFNPGRPSVLED